VARLPKWATLALAARRGPLQENAKWQLAALPYQCLTLHLRVASSVAWGLSCCVILVAGAFAGCSLAVLQSPRLALILVACGGAVIGVEVLKPYPKIPDQYGPCDDSTRAIGFKGKVKLEAQIAGGSKNATLKAFRSFPRPNVTLDDDGRYTFPGGSPTTEVAFDGNVTWGCKKNACTAFGPSGTGKQGRDTGLVVLTDSSFGIVGINQNPETHPFSLICVMPTESGNSLKMGATGPGNGELKFVKAEKSLQLSAHSFTFANTNGSLRGEDGLSRDSIIGASLKVEELKLSKADSDLSSFSDGVLSISIGPSIVLKGVVPVLIVDDRASSKYAANIFGAITDLQIIGDASPFIKNFLAFHNAHPEYPVELFASTEEPLVSQLNARATLTIDLKTVSMGFATGTAVPR
jgi:hypothetical protein